MIAVAIIFVIGISSVIIGAVAMTEDISGLPVTLVGIIVLAGAVAGMNTETAMSIDERWEKWYTCTQGEDDVKTEACDTFYNVPWSNNE